MDSLNISRAGIESGRAGALGQLARGEEIYAGAEERGLARTSPFTQYGQDAAQQEAALSGALGPEAQKAALDSFIESPGQKFMRERQEQALLRGSSATGGLGGGRVLTALQEQAQGIAATDLQRTQSNLGAIAGRGAQTGMGEQGFIGQMGAGMAGLAGAAAGVETGAAKDLAQIESIYGPQMAQLAMQTGLQLADIQQMSAQQQAGLMSSLGSGLAGIRSGTLGDIAGLAERQGTVGLDQANTEAMMLANIGIGGASQVAGYTSGAGAAQAAGAAARGEALASGLQGLGGAAALGYQQYNSNPGAFNYGVPGAGLPSFQNQGAAPIINPYTQQIQGGM